MAGLTTDLKTTSDTLTVEEDSGPTAIGITAPTDPNYPNSQLTVTVTGVPTDGTILLADGVTPIRDGETLTVAQLTGLLFQPTESALGVSSTFTYIAEDPSGAISTGSAILAIRSVTLPGAAAPGGGGVGVRMIDGSAGDLVIAAGPGQSVITGGAGDVIVGSTESGTSAITGSPGDAIMGGYGWDVIDGSAGLQVITGRPGHSTITGGSRCVIFRCLRACNNAAHRALAG